MESVNLKPIEARSARKDSISLAQTEARAAGALKQELHGCTLFKLIDVALTVLHLTQFHESIPLIALVSSVITTFLTAGATERAGEGLQNEA
ncbi:hypothetical protein MUK42_37095 [Musa troglodytarum]|uniref:Uncharacterized protein n=1 Tax=Musa troglodytarum TaxID=320322 RepID=A0A9E7FKA9_9LILI|nr:hypothetical protein MUK42_37095 [Musa troglodytarum]